MNSEQLVELVKEVVELEDITLESELDEELWDSLAVVTFISLVNERFDIVVPAEKVISANVVKDLL
ncbi:acyl carrier protein [Vibrio parahaemolyticus]|uniref:acyl carrier protein n=1 Tax=Vibrio owensii TaxID=696485 RepID=UPI001B82A2EC|nr:acyl carrier protein [Vibrio parahaemolyticus]EGR2698402.1 acyl carrier protein [Vibrio parahaemolyticus]EJE4179826.1 acyl carrier protein [Vibrio parahaemolyticus]MDG3416821.1 acyl carrier protein [Vibrio parahaemolyticus]HBC3541512.1 acyl carrier protein [Vibrio parahaemolyticus]